MGFLEDNLGHLTYTATGLEKIARIHSLVAKAATGMILVNGVSWGGGTRWLVDREININWGRIRCWLVNCEINVDVGGIRYSHIKRGEVSRVDEIMTNR